MYCPRFGRPVLTCLQLHKLKNVTYVGDYQTGASFEWAWTWQPIADTSANAGHRSFCAFVEYSQRDNNFILLAAMSFYVEDFSFNVTGPTSPPRRPGKGTFIPDFGETRLEPVPESPEMSNPMPPNVSPPLPSIEPIELSNPRDDEHFFHEIEDGPVFRSRVAALERKTSILKTKTKKCITRADALLEAQNAYFEAGQRWYESLQQLASTNTKAVQPLLSSYFDGSVKESHRFHRKKVAHLQYLINELRRIYDVDIKAAETKKRAFEEDSQEFYHNMGKYLARTDFPSATKQKEKDTKYQTRRREFDMKRFDYWAFINDLTGGKKEGEILHQLSQYMDKELDTLLEEAKVEKELKPGLDALLVQVEEASREFKLMRTEREQRRRDLEMGKAGAGDQVEAVSTSVSDGASLGVESVVADPAFTPGNGSSVSRGQWSSDVEDEDRLDPAKRKKEGILYAMSRPANHNDPKVIPKLAWHKYSPRLICWLIPRYWVVLDKGQLWEYTNWKRNSELHNESIHLAAANVREAQTSERRFCFELVTPVSCHLNLVLMQEIQTRLSSYLE
jgi:Arf-GAP with SH3 domain, ANK repeat and PH domain-containing protein